MATLTISTATSNSAKSSDYYDGQFDAVIGLPPKNQDGDYQSGYLDKVRQTGKTPF